MFDGSVDYVTEWPLLCSLTLHQRVNPVGMQRAKSQPFSSKPSSKTTFWAIRGSANDGVFSDPSVLLDGRMKDGDQVKEFESKELATA